MSFIVGCKNKDKYYLLAENSISNNRIKLAQTNPKDYKIVKFKHFKIAYLGYLNTFTEFNDFMKLSEIDFKPDYKYMLDEFFPKYLDFIVEHEYSEVNNGIIESTEFSLILMTEDSMYDVCEEFCYEVDKFNADGDDLIAFRYYDFLKDKMEPIELFKVIMKEMDKYSSESRYPYLVAFNDSDTLLTFNEDGSVIESRLEELWG